MELPAPSIRPWTTADRDAVLDLIVPIQQREFGLPITVADQPDLVDIEGAYRRGGGEFWVAVSPDGAAVGTIAAIVFAPGSVALRKMFVHANERGSGLAGRLMATVLAWAADQGHGDVVLGTTAVMHTAQRFYARHGFEQIDAAVLPAGFPRMAVDSVFFRRSV